MPIAPAVLAALITSAATIGTTVYEHVSAPDPNAALKAEQQQQQQTQQQQAQQAAQAAARQMAPTVQSQLGGAVSPDYYASVIANTTGNADQIAAVQKALAMNGISTPSTTSLTSSFSSPTASMPSTPTGTPNAIPNIQELLKNMQGGGNFGSSSFNGGF